MTKMPLIFRAVHRGLMFFGFCIDELNITCLYLYLLDSSNHLYVCTGWKTTFKRYLGHQVAG